MLQQQFLGVRNCRFLDLVQTAAVERHRCNFEGTYVALGENIIDHGSWQNSEMIFFPVSSGGYWILLVYNVAAQTLLVLDSEECRTSQRLQQLVQKLLTFHCEEAKLEYWEY